MEIDTKSRPPGSLDPALLEGPAEKLCKVLCCAAVLLLLFFTAQEVFVRGVLGYSMEISEELGGYLLLFIGMVGLPLCITRDSFQRTEYVDGWLSPRAKTGMRMAIDILTLIGGVVMLWQYSRYFMSSYSAGYFSPSRLQTPQWVPVIPMVFGAAFFVFTLCKAI